MMDNNLKNNSNSFRNPSLQQPARRRDGAEADLPRQLYNTQHPRPLPKYVGASKRYHSIGGQKDVGKQVTDKPVRSAKVKETTIASKSRTGGGLGQKLSSGSNQRPVVGRSKRRLKKSFINKQQSGLEWARGGAFQVLPSVSGPASYDVSKVNFFKEQ